MFDLSNRQGATFLPWNPQLVLLKVYAPIRQLQAGRQIRIIDLSETNRHLSQSLPSRITPSSLRPSPRFNPGDL